MLKHVVSPARTIDSRALIIAAMMLVMFAPNAFNFLPFMLGGAAEVMSLNDAQIESIAMYELLATALSSLLFSLLLIRRTNWRYIGYLAALALIAGNYLSMTAPDFDSFIISRLISGSGQGIGYSLGLVGMSVTRHPGRNFGYMIAALNIWLITWFIMIPELMATYGLDALYQFFMFASALCLVAFWFYPDNGRLDKDKQITENTNGQVDKKTFVVPMIWVGGAFLVYSLSLGIIYPYIEIIGADMQASTEDVGLVLAVGSVMAVVGGILTAVVDKKYSHTTIIVSLSIINGAVCFGMATTQDTASFLGFSAFYIMLWNMMYARYYTALATTDKSGYFSSYGPEIGTVGLAMGPIVAQAATATGDFQGQVGVGAICIAVATVMVFIGLNKSRVIERNLESTIEAKQ
ncbi:MFS transporter [Vibrio hangzhouensis]|uniref:Predicted arabinose efflux permease, MFS family n=1 Tax=Vibrio hangzhouensis TaxID=462991 RepID=A0A1H5Z9U1_9VIBR|nr:MFS transporter [Vibrio hangzhouensis]SEG33293.1 Predicted arabinose efflux permease, MFS family [Vibrio hangzhouensis]